MAVPSSGTIRMLYTAKELFNGDYTAPIPDSTIIAQFPNGISLRDMHTGSGYFINDPININSVPRPNGVSPHTMSEFYGYDHDAAAPSPPSLGIYNLTDPIFIDNEGWTVEGYAGNPDPVARAGYDWRLKTFTLNFSESYEIRLIIKYYHDGFSNDAHFFVNSIRVGPNDLNHYYPEREFNSDLMGQNSTAVNSPPTTWLAVNQNDGFTPTSPIWGYCDDNYGLSNAFGDDFLTWNPLLEIYQGAVGDTELSPLPPAYEPNESFYVHASDNGTASYNWIRTPVVEMSSGPQQISFIYATGFQNASFGNIASMSDYRFSHFQVFYQIV